MDGSLHPYFLSRMLFTPEQRDVLLQNVNAEAAEMADMAQQERLQSSLVSRSDQPRFLSRVTLLYAEYTLARLRFHEHVPGPGSTRSLD